ncbi:MAG: hypothetical protein GY756_02615 [bacterium]|nr:hypothetical protein [bacterium]
MSVKRLEPLSKIIEVYIAYLRDDSTPLYGNNNFFKPFTVIDYMINTRKFKPDSKLVKKYKKFIEGKNN